MSVSFCLHPPVDSKQHILQAVGQSQRIQNAVQIVSKHPAPSNWGLIYPTQCTTGHRGQLLLLLCLPTPLTLICGGETDHPAFGPPARLSFHLASSSITPAGSVHKSSGDNVMRMWVQLKRSCVSCVCMLQRGHSGDGCVLRRGDLFVLSWARVQRVIWGSISSELLMCGLIIINININIT